MQHGKIEVFAGSVDAGNENMTGKAAVLVALALYLDFVNIFLYLLRLFGKHRD
ncbi:MAG: hypothetical protein IJS39_07005 [Synergistaceae bacterium]|nr:hypothetical protein [Synergistaceae bacterium]